MIPVRLTAGFRLVQAAAGSPRRFSIDPAYTGGKLRVAGFRLPVVVDLSKLEAGRVQILLNHEKTTDATVGMADAIDNTGHELSLGGPITGTSPRVQDVIRAFDNGQQWEASIGCLFTKRATFRPVRRCTSMGSNRPGRSFWRRGQP